MKLFKLLPHRWPAKLALAVLIVTAGYLASELWRLRDVHQQFDAEWQSWQSFRTNAENVVLTSARLKEAEAAVVWITSTSANKRHATRMQTLLQSVEDPPPDTPPHVVERDAAVVRRELEKLDSPLIDDL